MAAAGKIGVGVIGANPEWGFAQSAHIPAIKSLPMYELVAVSTSRPESAKAAGIAFGVNAAYSHHSELVNHPDVDVVAVTVKVPNHFALVSAALDAGKMVYCEWPLGNGLAEAQALANMAKEKGLRNVVGLQVRGSPQVAYARHLVQSGLIGEVLSTTLLGTAPAWNGTTTSPNAYVADKRNGATMLTVPIGHSAEGLCWTLGEFVEVQAVSANRRKSTLNEDTGDVLPMTSEDQWSVSGMLESGAFATIRYRSGMSAATNFWWEINGTKGDLLITGGPGSPQSIEVELFGALGGAATMSPIAIPSSTILAPGVARGRPFNVGQLYAQLARDLEQGTAVVPDFHDAVRRHRFLAAVEESALSGARQRLARV